MINKNNPVVICRMPKAGLGNQLFPLVKAHTFAYLNKLPVMVINYHQFKPGPWLRGEKSKRRYAGFFNFQKNFFSATWDSFTAKVRLKKNVHEEPVIKVYDEKFIGENVFYFGAIPHYTKFFEGLNENRALAIKIFWSLITEANKKIVESQPRPCIGVHIRMGDFRKLKENEEFGKSGATRTPEAYFSDLIHALRKLNGSELPVSIFSDGRKEEFPMLAEIRNLRFVEGNNDMVDLLLLSRSGVIVASAGSTFSYWAGFISDSPIIMHPTFANIRIRPENVRGKLYEGAFDEQDQLCIEQIKGLKCY